jgi:hypothetical protein
LLSCYLSLFKFFRVRLFPKEEHMWNPHTKDLEN